MEEGKTSWIDWLIGVVLGLAAFVVYALTLSSGAYPGQSAGLMVQAIGAFPTLAPNEPLWQGLVWWVARIGSGDVVTRLNMLSAVFGALAVWWTYELSLGMVYDTIEPDRANPLRRLTAARLAGCGSAATLAFCIPFWIVSNRLHHAALHIFMLVLIAWIFLTYARTGKLLFALVTAFLYGLGIVEFATFIVLAPLFAVYALFWFVRHEHLRAGPILGVTLCGLAGLSLYVVAAAGFYGSEGYALRDYSSFFQILRYTWRDQFFLITRGLPQVGWLTILFLTALPWLVSLLVSRRALNEEKDTAYYILHIIITAIAISVLLNVKISPWAMLGFRQMLVTPYLLVALLMGYLIAYWFLLPSVWWQDAEESEARKSRNTLRVLFVLPLLAVVAVAPFRNIHDADGRPAQMVNRFASEVVGVLPPEVDWLVTDGVIDNHILVAAGQAGRRLKLLDLRSDDNPIYVKYVSGFFDKPRLKNLAHIGLRHLLHEWLVSDPAAQGRVAILANPELWAGSGFTEVPRELVFLGVRGTNQVPANLMAEHERFWDRFAPGMKQYDAGQMAGFRNHALRHMGLVANNLGTLMEDLGRPGDAFRAYSRAREIDPENVSALLNQWVMTGKGYAADQKESLKADMARMSENRARDYRIWSLASRYGYVRTPEAFAQLGWEWAMSGRPDMAVSGLKKALEMIKDGSRGEIMETLAGVYLAQDSDEKSETLYYELLVENPANRQALLGMARLASRKGNFRQAAEYLDKAEKAGADKNTVALELAAMHMSAGNLAQARVVLQGLVEVDPKSIRVWALLAEVIWRQKDEAGLQKCIQQLGEIKGGERLIPAAKAELALLQNNLDQARQLFTEMLAGQPKNTYLLGRILRLDVAQDRKTEGATHARRLLTLVPDHSFANYVIGSLQSQNMEYELAEDSLRKSLEKRRIPAALNDLAWVLAQRKEFVEAEKLVREALKMEENISEFWDTHAVILMKTGRIEEAEKAFDRALALKQDNPQIFLHMAEFQIKKGNKKKALELLEMISGLRRALSAADQETLGRLRREAFSTDS